MLRTTMIILATAAALSGGLTVDAFARGGGAHVGGGFGGVHVGGGDHVGGFGRGITGQHFGTRDHFDHGRGFRFGTGDYGLYDSGCGYAYPYYNPYASNCYPPEY